jgi:heme exporter protein B
MKMLFIASRMLRQEFLLSIRNPADWFNPLFFFVAVASLFPLAISPNNSTLQIIGPGIIWVAALLANLLSLNKLFSEDYRDGSLEQLVLSPCPMSSLLFVKIFAHWLLFCLPLIVISPLLALMYHLSAYAITILVISLLLGTPTLTYVGAILAALTVSLKNSGLLLALLLIPLYIPALIFGSAAVDSAEIHFPIAGQIAMLGALLAFSLFFSPWVTGLALRISLAFD